MKTAIRIVDLDSTVSDDIWRQWMIVPFERDPEKKYHSYHIHCDHDRVINREIVDASPVPVVFLTARPEYLRAKTIKWLNANNLKYLSLLMRDNSDHSHSPNLKFRALQFLQRLHEIESAYDDRYDVYEMYCDNRVNAVLV